MFRRSLGPRWLAIVGIGLVLAACQAAPGVQREGSDTAALPGPVCASPVAEASTPAGVRVHDLEHGFSLTLPPTWAQIDLSTGRPTEEFRTVPVPVGWEQLIGQIANAADQAGYAFMAIDLSPNVEAAGANPLFSDLIVGVRKAEGDDIVQDEELVDFAKELGATESIETVAIRIDGAEGPAVRYTTSQRFPDGQLAEVTVSLYGRIREGRAYLLLFTMPRGKHIATADAIAESFRLDGRVDC